MNSTAEIRPKEEIDWGDDREKYKIQPNSKYNAISNFVRTNVHHETMCSVFCGGKRCKYERMDKWPPEMQQIKGLFSHWITPKVVAISRPTTANIEKFGIMQQFKDEGIKSIINLQLVGEHVDCGDGNEDSGFSYKPEDFQREGIYFYNFGWQDYGFGSLSFILDSVKVMQLATGYGKVAVHCHAGLGRTGVLIACYLVYANRMSAYEAVNYVREKRPGAIQTGGQVNCIEQFEKYIQPSQLIFSHVTPKGPEFTLSTFLARQKMLLHGYEGRKLKFLPKIVYMCVERLSGLAGVGRLLGTYDTRHFSITVQRRSALGRGYGGGSEEDGGGGDASEPDHYIAVTTRRGPAASVTTQDSLGGSHGRPPPAPRKGGGAKGKSRRSYDDEEPSSGTNGYAEGGEGHFASGEVSGKNSSKHVIESLSRLAYSDETKLRVQQYQEALNADDHAWDELPAETDLDVLSWLLYSWLDHLKDPLVRIQDISTVYTRTKTSGPMVALGLIEKDPRFIVEYLLMAVVRLNPARHQEGPLLARLMSTLTHMYVDVNTAMAGSVTSSDSLASSSSLYAALPIVTSTPLGESHWQPMPPGTCRRFRSFCHKFLEAKRGDSSRSGLRR